MIPIEITALGMVLTLVAGLFIGVGLTLGGGQSSSPPPAYKVPVRPRYKENT